MSVTKVITAKCDVCGDERAESEVYRLRVATIPTVKILAGGRKVDGEFEALSIDLEIPFEDICSDCLKNKHFVLKEKKK